MASTFHQLVLGIHNTVDGVGRIPVMTSGTTSGVTVSASSETSGGEFWRSAGGNRGTLSQSNATASVDVTVDFGGSGFWVQKLAFWSRASNNNPTSISVAFSLDNVSFTQIFTVSGLPDTIAVGTESDFTWRSPGPYRYWKITLFNASTFVGWTGFQLYS